MNYSSTECSTILSRNRTSRNRTINLIFEIILFLKIYKYSYVSEVTEGSFPLHREFFAQVEDVVPVLLGLLYTYEYDRVNDGDGIIVITLRYLKLDIIF